MMFYCVGLISSCISYTYIAVLQNHAPGFKWIKSIGKYLPEWLEKPLISCVMCNAGQLALWYSILNNYSIVECIASASIAVVSSCVLVHSINKLAE